MLVLFEADVEAMAKWFGCAAAIFGALALLAVLFFWKRVSRWYSETFAKVGVAVFRFIAAGSVLANKVYASDAKTDDVVPPWVFPALIAGLGYLLWELTGVFGDRKLKTETEDSKRAAENANQLYSQQLRLMSTLRTKANEKFQHIRLHLAASSPPRSRLEHVRKALNPSARIRALLEAVAVFFSHAAEPSNNTTLISALGCTSRGIESSTLSALSTWLPADMIRSSPTPRMRIDFG